MRRPRLTPMSTGLDARSRHKTDVLQMSPREGIGGQEHLQELRRPLGLSLELRHSQPHSDIGWLPRMSARKDPAVAPREKRRIEEEVEMAFQIPYSLGVAPDRDRVRPHAVGAKNSPREGATRAVGGDDYLGFDSDLLATSGASPKEGGRSPAALSFEREGLGLFHDLGAGVSGSFHQKLIENDPGNHVPVSPALPVFGKACDQRLTPGTHQAKRPVRLVAEVPQPVFHPQIGQHGNGAGCQPVTAHLLPGESCAVEYHHGYAFTGKIGGGGRPRGPCANDHNLRFHRSHRRHASAPYCWCPPAAVRVPGRRYRPESRGTA